MTVRSLSVPPASSPTDSSLSARPKAPPAPAWGSGHCGSHVHAFSQSRGESLALSLRGKAGPHFVLYHFFFFNWRLITLQYCGGFCHTFTRVLRLGTREAQPSSHSPSGSKYSAGQLGIPHAAPQRQVSAVWASDQSWGSSRDLLLNGSPG